MTSTIPSESPGGGTIRTLIPRELAYSQKSIGLYIYNGNEDEASVREWYNVKPYNIPIDVVTNEVGENVSMDNRRLYAARNHAPPEQHLMGYQHNFTDPVPQNRVTTGAADILLSWETIDLASGEPEVHVIRAVISYWGLMVAFRCASQSPDFNLCGVHSEPMVRRNLFPFTPYYKIDGTDDKEIPMHDDAITALINSIDSGKIVCFSRSERGVVMHRPDFNQLISRHIGGLRVSSYFKYANRNMVLRAKGEQKDGSWPDDEELFRAENQRIEDIEVRWLEVDLEQVRIHSSPHIN